MLKTDEKFFGKVEMAKTTSEPGMNPLSGRIVEQVGIAVVYFTSVYPGDNLKPPETFSSKGRQGMASRHNSTPTTHADSGSTSLLAYTTAVHQVRTGEVKP
jgi:hypothetical protein